MVTTQTGLRERAREAVAVAEREKADEAAFLEQRNRENAIAELRAMLNNYLGITADEPLDGPEVTVDGLTFVAEYDWHGHYHRLRVVLGNCPKCSQRVLSGGINGLFGLGSALASWETDQSHALRYGHECTADEKAKPAAPAVVHLGQRAGELLAELLAEAGYELRRVW